MTEDQVRQNIRLFLSRYVRSSEPSDSEDIFRTKAVNSLFAMQIILHVERAFDVSIENEDMEIDNFCSVDAITRFVLAKRSCGIAE